MGADINPAMIVQQVSEGWDEAGVGICVNAEQDWRVGEAGEFSGGRSGDFLGDVAGVDVVLAACSTIGGGKDT